MSETSPNGQPEPRPYISKLEVSGFKSIRHAELELGRLNVLIGANGSGKSNLASLFRMLRAWSEGRLQHFVAQSGRASSLLHFGVKRTKSIDVVVEFNCDAMVPDSKKLGLNLGWLPQDDLMIQRADWLPQDDLMINIERVFDGPESGAIHGGTSETALNRPPETAPTLRNLALTRVYHFNDTTAEARIRLTGDIDDNVQLHGDGRNLAAFLYKLQQVWPKQFQFLTKVVRLVAPFFDHFVLRPNELNPRTIILRWREVSADEDFGGHLLSDGTLRFIALAALLTQSKEKLPPLIFLDEPEIGLHPYAITSLAGLIKVAARHTQIILATQSPDLLNHFEPADVIVTERHGGETEFKRLDAEKLNDWLEDYSLGELWEKNVIGGRPTR